MKAYKNINNVIIAIGINDNLFPDCIPIPITEEEKIIIEGFKLPKHINGEFIEAFIELIPVPAQVPNYKLRLALIHFGVLPSSIDLAISQIIDLVKQEQLYSLWNFAPFLERKDPKLIGMAADFGIVPEVLDQIFIYANKI